MSSKVESKRSNIQSPSVYAVLPKCACAGYWQFKDE